ncbi:MAG TPA: hypothetical protein QGI71_10650 [Dehalococcoidia bacterium]|jgi:hypothetical protein|nr:hypothetical protein [Dehalococcoidia bacterium]
MTAFTILGEGSAVEVDASTDGGPVRLSVEGVERALGWELQEEGFCLGPVCYPVPPDTDLVTDAGVDLVGLATLIDRPIALDETEHAAYLGVSACERSRELELLYAPDFTVPDLDGEPHSLSDHRGKKVLLVAYASW